MVQKNELLAYWQSLGNDEQGSLQEILLNIELNEKITNLLPQINPEIGMASGLQSDQTTVFNRFH